MMIGWLSSLTALLSRRMLPVVGVTALCVFFYAMGAQRQKALCHAAELKSVIASQASALRRVREQLEAVKEARAVADARAERDAIMIQKEREDADAFKKDLRDRVGRCPISAGDAERLRQIGQ